VAAWVGPAVATAVHRLRRRFRELVRSTLAETVTTQADLDEEMRYLLEALGTSGH